ncbi:MAG: DUF3460 family protein [Pseudomonadota bacterium]
MAYESEHTKFMREWLRQHPEELDVQKSGRALWWDRGPRDLEEQQRLAAARVPQKAYYYDVN